MPHVRCLKSLADRIQTTTMGPVSVGVAESLAGLLHTKFDLTTALPKPFPCRHSCAARTSLS